MKIYWAGNGACTIYIMHGPASCIPYVITQSTSVHFDYWKSMQPYMVAYLQSRVHYISRICHEAFRICQVAYLGHILAMSGGISGLCQANWLIFLPVAERLPWGIPCTVSVLNLLYLLYCVCYWVSQSTHDNRSDICSSSEGITKLATLAPRLTSDRSGNRLANPIYQVVSKGKPFLFFSHPSSAFWTM